MGDAENRVQARQSRRANGFLGDEEGLAVRVLERATGGRVALTDDGTADAIPDLAITLQDGTTHAGEVVADVDPAYAEITELLRRDGGYPRWSDQQGLNGVWWLRVGPGYRLSAPPRRRRSTPTIGELLATAEQTARRLGDHHLDLLDGLGPRTGEHAAAGGLGALQALRDRGVRELTWSDSAADDPGRWTALPHGASGPVSPDWQQAAAWLTGTLAADRLADVRRKLEAAATPQRHLVLLITLSSDTEHGGAAFLAFAGTHHPLPAARPDLPAEITHLWLIPTPAHGRCLLYDRTHGWRDVDQLAGDPHAFDDLPTTLLVLSTDDPFEPVVGKQFRATHLNLAGIRAQSVTPQMDGRWGLLDGALLALVIDDANRESPATAVPGTATMIAPGLAITAAHVVRPYLERLLTGERHLFALGIRPTSADRWAVRHIHLHPEDDSDIAYLSVSLNSAVSDGWELRLLPVSTRRPKIGETATVMGYRFPDTRLVDGHPQASGSLHAASGSVLAVHAAAHPERTNVPFWSIEIECGLLNGMSGGPVLDVHGHLVGVCSSSFDFTDSPPLTTAQWIVPSLADHISPVWPRGLHHPQAHPVLHVNPRVLPVTGRNAVTLAAGGSLIYQVWDDDEP